MRVLRSDLLLLPQSCSLDCTASRGYQGPRCATGGGSELAMTVRRRVQRLDLAAVFAMPWLMQEKFTPCAFGSLPRIRCIGGHVCGAGESKCRRRTSGSDPSRSLTCGTSSSRRMVRRAGEGLLARRPVSTSTIIELPRAPRRLDPERGVEDRAVRWPSSDLRRSGRGAAPTADGPLEDGLGDLSRSSPCRCFLAALGRRRDVKPEQLEEPGDRKRRGRLHPEGDRGHTKSKGLKP